jgi:hypothetical protein
VADTPEAPAGLQNEPGFTTEDGAGFGAVVVLPPAAE